MDRHKSAPVSTLSRFVRLGRNMAAAATLAFAAPGCESYTDKDGDSAAEQPEYINRLEKDFNAVEGGINEVFAAVEAGDITQEGINRNEAQLELRVRELNGITSDSFKVMDEDLTLTPERRNELKAAFSLHKEELLERGKAALGWLRLMQCANDFRKATAVVGQANALLKDVGAVKTLEELDKLAKAVKTLPRDYTACEDFNLTVATTPAQTALVEAAKAPNTPEDADALKLNKRDVASRIALARGRLGGTYDLEAVGDSVNNDALNCPKEVDCLGKNDKADARAKRVGAMIRAIFSGGARYALKYIKNINTPDFDMFYTDEGEGPAETPTLVRDRLFNDPAEFHEHYRLFESALLKSNPFGIRMDGKNGVVVDAAAYLQEELAGGSTEAKVFSHESLARLLAGPKLNAYAQTYIDMVVKRGWEKFRPVLDHQGWRDSYNNVPAGFVDGWPAMVEDKACGGDEARWNLHKEYAGLDDESQFWARRANNAAKGAEFSTDLWGAYMLRFMNRLGMTNDSTAQLAAHLKTSPALQGDTDGQKWLREVLKVPATAAKVEAAKPTAAPKPAAKPAKK